MPGATRSTGQRIRPTSDTCHTQRCTTLSRLVARPLAPEWRATALLELAEEELQQEAAAAVVVDALEVQQVDVEEEVVVVVAAVVEEEGKSIQTETLKVHMC